MMAVEGMGMGMGIWRDGGERVEVNWEAGGRKVRGWMMGEES
jgi:hypothetical protein